MHPRLIPEDSRIDMASSSQQQFSPMGYSGQMAVLETGKVILSLTGWEKWAPAGLAEEAERV